jgi:hypothetical protein
MESGSAESSTGALVVVAKGPSRVALKHRRKLHFKKKLKPRYIDRTSMDKREIVDGWKFRSKQSK